MKKMLVLCFIVPVPFIVGLILDIVGYRVGNVALAEIGVKIMTFGTPLTMFAAVVLSLVMLLTGRWSLDDGKSAAESSSAAETESRKIEDINTSYGRESQLKNAQFQADYTADNYRKASRNEKIKGWLFFGFLMSDFALIFVFGALNITIGCIVCVSLFVGTILISLIVKIILERTSMSQKFNPDKYEQKLGTVRARTLSSMGTTGGARRNSTVRVSSIVYRVVADVDGEIYNAYSATPYNEGDVVIMAVKKKGGRLAKIINENNEKELG